MSALLIFASSTVNAESAAPELFTYKPSSPESGRRIELGCGDFVATIVCGHSEEFTKKSDGIASICNNNTLTISRSDGKKIRVDHRALRVEEAHGPWITPQGIACVNFEGEYYLDATFSTTLPYCARCASRILVDRNGKSDVNLDNRYRGADGGSAIPNFLFIETDQFEVK